MDLNTQKEEFSYAYVYAVASEVFDLSGGARAPIQQAMDKTEDEIWLLECNTPDSFLLRSDAREEQWNRNLR